MYYKNKPFVAQTIKLSIEGKKKKDDKLMRISNKTSSDLRNEKYAGVSYPIPPKASEILKEEIKINVEEKKAFGKKLTITFFNKNKK
ncbi:pol polyprotein [Vairimorpha necatrix]|uniref:Pol polyprotein n=1 Tax=Vairimorpha necatrix TaxID=6039 RepID=A0AAX4J874_9MICR